MGFDHNFPGCFAFFMSETILLVDHEETMLDILGSILADLSSRDRRKKPRESEWARCFLTRKSEIY
jgi:hypothetical protein